MTIDQMSYHSNLRYVNASEKFAYSILSLIICVASRSLAVAGIVFAVNGILSICVGGISASHYIKLLRIPFAFLILGTAAIIINITSLPGDALAIPFISAFISVSFEGLYRGTQLILTAMASVSCLYFLALSTPMTDFLQVLKKMHCPELMVELMMLIYRYIFLLQSIAGAIRISQDSRLGNKDYKTAVKSFGKMLSVVFMRALHKANLQFDAMEARCYDGSIRVLYVSNPPRKRELAGIVVFELFLILCVLGGRLL